MSLTEASHTEQRTPHARSHVHACPGRPRPERSQSHPLAADAAAPILGPESAPPCPADNSWRGTAVLPTTTSALRQPAPAAAPRGGQRNAPRRAWNLPAP